MQEGPKPNLILQLTFEFALAIIKYANSLEKQNKFVLARQVLRSGTNIGANIREAQHAGSKGDFIHKIKIAIKEANETEYWLLLCNNSEGFESCEGIIKDCHSIIKVLSKIIASTLRNRIQPGKV